MTNRQPKDDWYLPQKFLKISDWIFTAILFVFGAAVIIYGIVIRVAWVPPFGLVILLMAFFKDRIRLLKGLGVEISLDGAKALVEQNTEPAKRLVHDVEAVVEKEGPEMKDWLDLLNATNRQLEDIRRQSEDLLNRATTESEAITAVENAVTGTSAITSRTIGEVQGRYHLVGPEAALKLEAILEPYVFALPKNAESQTKYHCAEKP